MCMGGVWLFLVVFGVVWGVSARCLGVVWGCLGLLGGLSWSLGDVNVMSVWRLLGVLVLS